MKDGGVLLGEEVDLVALHDPADLGGGGAVHLNTSKQNGNIFFSEITRTN